ncbi:MAG: tetratricopeptide (TPR) repeat protein [Bradymonadia bacterium]|jgi:tetratricopeptide (TPR) repeat protein
MTQRKIGPYSLIEKIGVGGMGEVYRASAPGRAEVAIKLLRPELATQPEVRRRFTREARAAAKLEHRHIVKMLDFGSEGGEFYIVMELVRGGPLATWRDNPPDGETLTTTADQILQALAYAHARGVVHRDLKPENVLVSFGPDGLPQAKVMDFGVVFFRDERDLDISGLQALVGTPAYMAPEQALNLSDVSPATDLYSFGVMLFELLTADRPYSGKGAAGMVVAHMNTPIPPVSLRSGYGCDGNLDGLMQRFLAKDPANRYLFAADARKALKTLHIYGSAAPSEQQKFNANTLAGVTIDNATHGAAAPLPASSQTPEQPGSAYRLFGLVEPPFTGRLAELQTARVAALEAANARQPGALLISGEMGMGKTRLLRQLRESVEERGLMQVWSGGYDGSAEGYDIGYRQAIRRGLGVSGLGPSELRVRVEQILARQGVTDTWELDAVCELLLPHQGLGEPLLRNDEMVFALVRRILTRACKDRPVLLSLDDVHLSDGESLRLVRSMLGARSKPAPWFAVASFRPEHARGTTLFADSVGRLGTWAGTVELERLGLEDIGEIITRTVPIGAELARVIAMRSFGNPMFAVELVRHLVDSGRLEGYGTAPSVDDVLDDIPNAVGALLSRRIDEAANSAGADARTIDVWEALAFLGLRFNESLALVSLERTRMGLELHLSAALDVAVTYGILVEEEANEFRFDSGLLRDSLIERATNGGRAALQQRRAGDAKANHYSKRIGEFAMEIARHYQVSLDLEDAARYTLIAADHASSRRRYAAALDAYHCLQTLAPDVPGGDDLTDVALLGLADTNLNLARYEDARVFATSAKDHAMGLGKVAPAESTRLLAEVARFEGELRQARDLYRLARAAFADSGDGLGVARSEFGRGKLELLDGKPQAAEQHFRAARDGFAELQDAAGEADTLRELAQTAHAIGLHAEAQGIAKQAFRRFQQNQDRRGAALCLLTLGDVALALDNFAEATAFFARARSELQTLGDWHDATIAMMSTGVAAQGEDRLEAARAAYCEAHEAFRQMGDQRSASVVAMRIGHVDAELGRWNQAEPRIREVLKRDQTERIDAADFVGVLIELARSALFGGRTHLARELLSTAGQKLELTSHESPLYDRVDEVHYLLAELGEEGGLDEPTAVVDLFADDD